jgi:uncharacterized membrane protein YfcA
VITAGTLALLAAGGGLIGFLLAVLGAGGSILLMPLLISGAALPTREAIPLSLLVVTLLALANVGPYLRRRQVAWRPALILGVPALAGSWIGGSLVKAGLIPEPVQLVVFALAALVASWLLTHRSAPRERPPRHGSAGATLGSTVSLALQGVVVGLLTGIAGVGGGFAIVPALVALKAQGHWPAASLPMMLPLLAGGALGGLVGQWLAPHLPERQLRRGFAALLIGSALLTGVEAWKRQTPPESELTQAQSARPTPAIAPMLPQG